MFEERKRNKRSERGKSEKLWEIRKIDKLAEFRWIDHGEVIFCLLQAKIKNLSEGNELLSLAGILYVSLRLSDMQMIAAY